MSFEENLFKLIDTYDPIKNAEAKSLLQSTPRASFDINWINSNNQNCGFLHAACTRNRHEIVIELLKHPDINPNQKQGAGWTPFHFTCYWNEVESLRLLLNDSRVNITDEDDDGNTGLMLAIYDGHTEVIEKVLASMRNLTKMDVICTLNLAQEWMRPQIVSLLQDYRTQPFNTVKRLRVKLNLKEYGPVTAFVHVILLCDGYYALKAQHHADHILERKSKGFFQMVIKVPLELQMMICNRIFDLPTNLIKANLINQALKFMIADQVIKL